MQIMLRRLNDALPRPRWLALSADPVFRVLTSLIFIVGGLGHFVQPVEMLRRIADSPWSEMVGRVAEPAILLWLSGAVFVVFGVTLALGLWARLSALALFVTLVPITLAVHLAPDQLGPLFKNVAILGALYFIYVRGAGQLSLDRLAAQRKAAAPGCGRHA
jgi:putative oxidoreductase